MALRLTIECCSCERKYDLHEAVQEIYQIKRDGHKDVIGSLLCPFCGAAHKILFQRIKEEIKTE